MTGHSPRDGGEAVKGNGRVSDLEKDMDFPFSKLETASKFAKDGIWMEPLLFQLHNPHQKDSRAGKRNGNAEDSGLENGLGGDWRCCTTYHNREAPYSIESQKCRT